MVAHFEDTWVFYHFEDLEFAIFVAFVLEDFFDGDFLSGAEEVAEIYRTEGSFSRYSIKLIFILRCGSRCVCKLTIWLFGLCSEVPCWVLMGIYFECSVRIY